MDSGRGALEVVVMAYSEGAPGCGLGAGEGWTRVVNSVSGVTSGIAAIVTPVEAATEGVVLALVEVDSGVSVWRAEVTSVAAETFATLAKGRALKRRTEKLKDAYKGNTNKSEKSE